jgi:saccharopine dehydrogenase (NAD+, L-lysine-forming)
MCETFSGRVENLDYKSLRYPGHASLMNFFFHELLMREDRIQAGKILTHAKPPVDDDVVFVHAAAEGWADGLLGRREFVRAYHPITIIGRTRTAIAWTTAASACAVIELARSDAFAGEAFVKQETIPLERFLKTGAGRLFAEHGRIGR